MKTKINSRWIIAFFLTLFILFLGTDLFSRPDDKKVTIIGTIEEADWDEEDNATAVAIAVRIPPKDPTEEEDYEYYLVVNDKKGKELLKLVGENIKATGTVEIDEEDNKMIRVISYKVIRTEIN